ncbi:hypothetical protein [Kitasatospora sp. DSM 101779]|uniref:hypothetical protein n=1 Tax=Kitasatospora sp. DSM 101779 TaxID=2853165 RepID=UPI0021DB3FE7|nr:hypothetical protein [Kitasatospora sp. DSM 101779]MCU7826846.1 hypothetical protein [Kitasatospora sp. DSM 101779]
MSGEHTRAPSAIVHMSISGSPSAAQAVADAVGQSFRLTTAPDPVTAGDYAAPSEAVNRERWQVDTAAPIEDAAAQPVAPAAPGTGSVRVELGGRPDAVRKVMALIRGCYRSGPPAGVSQGFEVWPEDRLKDAE